MKARYFFTSSKDGWIASATAGLLLLLLFGMVATTPAVAEGKKESMSDCKYWKGDLIMSTSSGAVGHVVDGRLVKKQWCKYDVRFHLGNQLVIVTNMADYELMWAPEKEKTKPEPQAGPEELVGDLDFGG